MSGSVVMLATDKASTRMLYHALAQDIDIERVVIVEPAATARFLRARARKLGLAKVAGQVLFKMAVCPVLEAQSQRRLQEIAAQHGLREEPIPEDKVVRVGPLNSEETTETLRALQPAVVVVHATPIISGAVLSSVTAPFVNIHAGITPAYRGVHGAYWALVEGRRDLCGVTVHFVDEGIDTGKVIGQALIDPGAGDSFVTYGLLQLAAGIPIIRKSISDILRSDIELQSPLSDVSRLRTHPTLLEYLVNRWRRGVR